MTEADFALNREAIVHDDFNSADLIPLQHEFWNKRRSCWREHDYLKVQKVWASK